MSQTPPQQLRHLPVLLAQTLAVLRPNPGDSYLDLTAGYGGHAQVILDRIGSNAASRMTLVDRDEMAEKALRPLIDRGARFIRSDFLSAAQELATAGEQFDMILADLGVSSPQLDNAQRGFSFQKEGPLDMRMDQRDPITAADIVNTYPADRLSQIIRDYGEEPRATVIARAIVAHRPYTTTTELAEAIEHTLHRSGRIHPATRTFQAIRIELNQELEQVKALLPLIPPLLKPGGRVAVISFHSLEDRLIKQFFADKSYGYEAELELLTKKPITGATDDASNPRARSAKLRAAVKIKKERGKDE